MEFTSDMVKKTQLPRPSHLRHVAFTRVFFMKKVVQRQQLCFLKNIYQECKLYNQFHAKGDFFSESAVRFLDLQT